MATPEEIKLRYNKTFIVRVIDPDVDGPKISRPYERYLLTKDGDIRVPVSTSRIREVRIDVKRIVIGEEFTKFFDYHDDLSGVFKNDLIIGYACEI